MCKRKGGFACTGYCEKHCGDIYCGTKVEKQQMERIRRLRIVNLRMKQAGIAILPWSSKDEREERVT
jgi:hypothetical protein